MVRNFLLGRKQFSLLAYSYGHWFGSPVSRFFLSFLYVQVREFATSKMIVPCHLEKILSVRWWMSIHGLIAPCETLTLYGLFQ
jgi:hypothetical protein